MSIRRRVALFAYRFVCLRPVNNILRALLGLVASRLPDRFLLSVPVVGTVVFEGPDGRLVSLESDGADTIATRLHWRGIEGFEPETIRLFSRLLETSEVVFDIGANVGVYSLLAGAAQPARSVTAFEPVSRNIAYLERNVALNAAWNVSIVRSAVSDRSGKIRLQVPKSTRLPVTATTLPISAQNFESVDVDVTTIDDYVDGQNLNAIDLIKIDVEGAELSVVIGARRTIERFRPAIICEMLEGSNDDSELAEILEDLDYTCFVITDGGLRRMTGFHGDETGAFKNCLLITQGDLDSRLPGATPVA